jgi:nickel transport system substrate-binding protein
MRPRYVLAAVLATSLLAAPALSAKTTITYSWPTNVGSLNPHLYQPEQMFAQGMVYEPLVRTVEGGGIEPWLAQSWTISDDGRVYTFTLRQGVSFTDGTPFDAAAVKANVDAVMANRERHAWLALVDRIESVAAPDARTVVLTLESPYDPALRELSLIRPLRFMSPAAMPADGNTANGIAAPVGTGPWKLVETVLGERDVFVRNEAYWGEKPAADRIVVTVVPDPNTRALAMTSGDIDLIYGTNQIAAAAFDRFAHDPGFVAAISPPLATRVLAMNSAHGPTADLMVRRAIEHGVDRAAIVHGVLFDVERPAETLFAANVPYADVGLSPYAFDPAEAARLLDEAGWRLAEGADVREKDGETLTVDLVFVGNLPLQKAIAEAVQSDLRRIGIDLRLLGEEQSSVYARQKSGEFGMIFGDTWGAPYDPASFMSSMRVPAHADYQAQAGLAMKAEIDERIGRALSATDEEARAEDYRWLLTTLHEQAVYLPISYTTAMVVYRKGELDGVGFGPSQYEVPFGEMEPLAGE